MNQSECETKSSASTSAFSFLKLVFYDSLRAKSMNDADYVELVRKGIRIQRVLVWLTPMLLLLVAAGSLWLMLYVLDHPLSIESVVALSETNTVPRERAVEWCSIAFQRGLLLGMLFMMPTFFFLIGAKISHFAMLQLQREGRLLVEFYDRLQGFEQSKTAKEKA